MALLLSIDTAMDTAIVVVSHGPRVLSFRSNSRQTDHASWVHTAITTVLQEADAVNSELEAVAVTAGPGSYTGLRVGMATAKGLCFAGKLPLITISTLKLTAAAVQRSTQADAWSCPMIDARRLEVFTATYDQQMQEQLAPAALVLTAESFFDLLQAKKVIFCGSGSVKWRSICTHPNAMFSDINYSAADLVLAASTAFDEKNFADLAYAEPTYLKNAYTGTKEK